MLTPYPKDVNVTVFEYLSKSHLRIDSFNSFYLNYVTITHPEVSKDGKYAANGTDNIFEHTRSFRLA